MEITHIVVWNDSDDEMTHYHYCPFFSELDAVNFAKIIANVFPEDADSVKVYAVTSVSY